MVVAVMDDRDSIEARLDALMNVPVCNPWVMRAIKAALVGAVIVGVVGLLAGCSTVQAYGQRGIDERRNMNDLQARGTLAALCDISVGSMYRTMTLDEQGVVRRVCDPKYPTQLETF